jgi:phage-related protein
MTTIPNGIRTSAFQLAPEGLAYLFKLTLTNGSIFRMSPKQQVTWQGWVYENLPCGLSQIELEADGKSNRPNFSFANPEGLFTAAVGQGLLENATITRYTLLYSDLVANQPFFVEESWRIVQVLSVVRGLITTQCREPHDMQTFMLPARAFYPPEFPHVRL